MAPVPARPAFKRILVDIDAAAGEHPAIAQALAVAERTGAQVRIVDVVPPVPSRARRYLPPTIERDLVGYRMTRLTSLISTLGHRDVAIDASVLVGVPAIALTQEVMAGGYDLLVRSHGRSGSAEK